MSAPIGIYLRSRRLRARLTQAEVARALGHPTAETVSNWERCIGFPSPTELLQMIQIFNYL